MKAKTILIVSVLAGLLAFWLTHRYLAGERDRLQAGVQRVKVIVAQSDLPAGATLRAEDLALKSVDRGAVGGQAVLPEETDLILGKKLRFGLRRFDPLLWAYVDAPERLRGGLAPAIQPGLRAVSLAIGGDAAVSGLVQPNDRVDILGTFTFPARNRPGQMETVTLTVLQDVSVLATGQRLARGEVFGGAAEGARGGAGYSMVTFEVTPREAELLVFAQALRGNLTMTLRHPDDPSFERTLPEVNFDVLEQSLPELNLFRQRNLRHKREL